MIQTNRTASGGFIIAEMEDFFSRRVVIVAANQGQLNAGTVLGKITSSGKYVARSASADDGSEVAAAILFAYKEFNDSDEQVLVVNFSAAVRSNELTWADTAPEDIETGIAQLERLSIQVQ